MSREEITQLLTDAGYEVVRLGSRYATVRSRDIYGQPFLKRIEWLAECEYILAANEADDTQGR